MIRGLVYLLYFLIILFFVRLVTRSVGRLFGVESTARRSAGASRPSSRQTEDLVLDRICNTHVPRSRALAAKVGDREEHFCSEACRDKARGDACSFQGRRRQVNGSCDYMRRGNQLVCKDPNRMKRRRMRRRLAKAAFLVKSFTLLLPVFEQVRIGRADGADQDQAAKQRSHLAADWAVHAVSSLAKTRGKRRYIGSSASIASQS